MIIGIGAPVQQNCAFLARFVGDFWKAGGRCLKIGKKT
jgi:hypothetical protein